MKVIAVDDESLALESIMELLEKVLPEAEITGFQNAAEAFEYLGNNKVDIAFLDIEMGEYSGLSLAKKCQTLCPEVNIIFVTGYSEYALDAIKLHVSGYLLKPVQEKELIAEIEHLRYPVSYQSKKRVRIQTFGNFEIFVDEKPLDFPRTKCKECMAYLVDCKGAKVTSRELAAILYEDEPYERAIQNRIHQVIFAMMKALKKEGIEDIIIRSHSEIALDTSKVDCDYYKLLQGESKQKSGFNGKYMSNYSWAEHTLGELYD